MARKVLLVGSMPLSSSKEVFETVGEELGSLAQRIPDGETGDRILWVIFQHKTMDAAGNLERVKSYDFHGVPLGSYRIVDPAKPVTIGSLRYAAEAKASYAEFKKLKEAGKVPATARFQVSLPTPLVVIGCFIEAQDQAVVEAAYEKRLLEEMNEIAASIPHDDLAIQWDVCWDILFLTGWTGGYFHDTSWEGILSRVARLGDAVPEGVELGFHLCYGDPDHSHVVEPEDLSLCVKVSNDLAQRVHRTIDWVHMPVPRDRNDDAYVAPLRQLEIGHETDLFLGLVHRSDGVEGGSRRIATVEKVRSDFGIATECGFGRRPKETVREVLALHKELATS